MDTMTVPVYKYVTAVIGTATAEAVKEHLIPLTKRVDNGELVYKKAGSYGATMPKISGWYLADDNPQALSNPP